MRKFIAALTILPLLSACSLSFNKPGEAPEVKGTPPTPKAEKSIEATISNLPKEAVDAIPDELAMSLHYRRSDASAEIVSDFRKTLEDFMQAVDSSRTEMREFNMAADEFEKIKTLDLFFAAPTDPLSSMDDLENLAMTGCIAGSISVDDGMIKEALDEDPPEGMITVDRSDDSITAWYTGCDNMDAFSDAEKIKTLSKSIAGDKANLVYAIHPGHDLIHDPVLWEEMQALYEEGVESELNGSSDEEMVRDMLDKIEGYVAKLNVWQVLKESNVMLAAWTFEDNGDWSAEMLGGFDTEKSAELVRRSSVGTYEANIMLLSQDVVQEVKSLTEDTNMAVRVTYKNPDVSVMLRPLAGAAFGMMAVAMADEMDSSYYDDDYYYDEDYLSDDDYFFEEELPDATLPEGIMEDSDTLSDDDLKMEESSSMEVTQ